LILLLPYQKIIGDRVVVEADIFADGYDVLDAVLFHRKESDPGRIEVPMEFMVDDWWGESFMVISIYYPCFYIMGTWL